MTAPPAFQFYPNDFLSDANVIVMSLTERGAYITLLCVCWQQGSLPNDPARLARLCGSPAAAFRRLWPALVPCFLEDESGRLVNPRLEKERERQAAFRRLQSEKGKQSGEIRRGSGKQPDGNHGSTAVEPSHEPETNSSILSLQPSSSSSGSSLRTEPASIADARSKRPIFKGQRLVVFEWMVDDLRRMLGSAIDRFDIHAWFSELDAQVTTADIVLPQRDNGRWLFQQTLIEAERRGMAVATPGPTTGKTANNSVAAASFVARGQL